jgi:hypothetical protein
MASTKTAFEQLKGFFRDLSNKVGDPVDNLYGVIDSADIRPRARPGQAWYGMETIVPEMPTLDQYVNAYTFARPGFELITSTVGEVEYVLTPDDEGKAVMLATGLKFKGETVFPISVNAPGYDLAIYVNKTRIASGREALSATPTILKGAHFIFVIARGNTGPVTVTTKPDLQTRALVPVPDSPTWADAGGSGYVDVEEELLVSKLTWLNDAFAGSWGVYRALPANLGFFPTPTANGDGTYTMVFTGDINFKVGDFLYTEFWTAGDLLDVQKDEPVTQTTVVINPTSDAPDPATWPDFEVIVPSAYSSLGQVPYSGSDMILYEDNQVVNGKLYFYKVTAFGFIDGSTESNFSPELPLLAAGDALRADIEEHVWVPSDRPEPIVQCGGGGGGLLQALFDAVFGTLSVDEVIPTYWLDLNILIGVLVQSIHLEIINDEPMYVGFSSGGNTASTFVDNTVDWTDNCSPWDWDQWDVLLNNPPMRRIRILDGTGAGQEVFVSDLDTATGTFSITPDWSEVPDATSQYEFLPGILEYDLEFTEDGGHRVLVPPGREYGIHSWLFGPQGAFARFKASSGPISIALTGYDAPGGEAGGGIAGERRLVDVGIAGLSGSGQILTRAEDADTAAIQNERTRVDQSGIGQTMLTRPTFKAEYYVELGNPQLQIKEKYDSLPGDITQQTPGEWHPVYDKSALATFTAQEDTTVYPPTGIKSGETFHILINANGYTISWAPGYLWANQEPPECVGLNAWNGIYYTDFTIPGVCLVDIGDVTGVGIDGTVSTGSSIVVDDAAFPVDREVAAEIAPTFSVAGTLSVTKNQFNQSSFRVRENDGVEVNASWAAAADTDVTRVIDPAPEAEEGVLRLRFLVQSTTAKTNALFQLRASHNVGTYFDVNQSSTYIRPYDSPYMVDGEHTTQQLGSGTYVTRNFGYDEVDGIAGPVTFAGSDEAELEFSVELIYADLADTDTLDFQLFPVGDPDGLAFITETPRVTVDDTDLIGYWVADQITGLSDGDTITAMTDLSSNGNNGVLKNTMKWQATTGPDGGPAILIDEDLYADSGWRMNVGTGVTGLHMVMVEEILTPIADNVDHSQPFQFNDGDPVSSWPRTGGTGNYLKDVFGQQTGTYSAWGENITDDNVPTDPYSDTNYLAEDWKIVDRFVNSTHYAMYWNNRHIWERTTTPANWTFDPQTYGYIGYNEFYNFGWRGRIAEVRVSTTEPSAAKRTAIFKYLKAKYAIPELHSLLANPTYNNSGLSATATITANLFVESQSASTHHLQATIAIPQPTVTATVDPPVKKLRAEIAPTFDLAATNFEIDVTLSAVLTATADFTLGPLARELLLSATLSTQGSLSAGFNGITVATELTAETRLTGYLKVGI